MLLAIAVFCAVYVLIVSEKLHRTVVALLGAVIMISLGLINQKQALTHIDFNTLGLLVGMMIMVNITSETGMFNYMAIKAAKLVKAKPVPLLFVLSLITSICSAILDNVTTVLLMVPIIFSITNQLKLKVRPFLVAQILASNIGGAATLIGDPPNIMIGSAAGLNFSDFIINMLPICLVVLVANFAVIYLLFHKSLHTTEDLQARIMRLRENRAIKDKALLIKCLGCIAITIVLFMFHGVIHLETATAALIGASLLMLLTLAQDEEMLNEIFSRVEWLSIFFFIGLFIMVGALIEAGVIKLLAAEAMKLTHGNIEATAILILWLSAFASAFIDNIPFVATILPLIEEMGRMGMGNLEPVYWALALGACLGGNGTLVGASSNIVVASMAAQRGKSLSFAKFLKLSLPLMVLSMAICHTYIVGRYF